MMLAFLGWFVLGLLAPSAQADLPATAVVVADTLDVYDEPDVAAFSTGKVRRGERVVVVDVIEEGWLAIEPPRASFSWIDQETINDIGGGVARVIVPQTTVRAGRPGARMPGSARWVLHQGDTVHLVDRPALTLRQGRANRTWQAIEPPHIELRYVRAGGVKFVGHAPFDANRAQVAAPSGAGHMRRASERFESIDPGLANAGPAPVEGSLPAEVAAAMAQVEALHRSILRQPVDRWQLEPVRQRYQALLDRATDTTVQAALRARLERLSRQDALARAARSFETLVDTSRQHDLDVVRLRDLTSHAATADVTPYDAEGLLQTSSRQVDGQAVYALIGKKGQTAAYLSFPPGLGAEALVARRVGVRGTVHFNESLRTNLINVRELDPLSDPP